MKSPDKLFIRPARRRAFKCTAMPTAHAAALRELADRTMPHVRSVPCLRRTPAVPMTDDWSQAAYSEAANPTPPAAACRSKESNALKASLEKEECTVHHVLTRVVAAANDIDMGFRACNRASHRAEDARQEKAMPKEASLSVRCRTPQPIVRM
eukprot:scaffold281896_cov34-Tisochrysis_lutea.AAC.1